jgi:hypothetical protein
MGDDVTAKAQVIEISADDVMRARERIKRLQKEIEAEKKKISRGRKKVMDKFKIILGSYAMRDKEKLKNLVQSEPFKSYLSEKDKEFMAFASLTLFPDVFAPSSPAVTSPKAEVKKSESQGGKSPKDSTL